MNESVFIVGIIFFSIAFVIKILSDNQVRRSVIHKGEIDANLKVLFQHDPGPSSLKWGIVLIFIGIAFIISQFIPSYYSDNIVAGLVFILAGVGLLVYYLFASKLVKKSIEE